ncbi:Heterogeneous nuclear ribonucleoprotein U-like protein 1 [Orchesella cincta]|uniref:Heterogeneous nuclear ribonucleoprotein U-like protein 1 n=1 Tax=Orchesella cincta TaxID=48709 RepID=A0A1D2M650_ORCCI|nr:Heterogeneous nuclear ribonucleoprotein U-like protein 1 [Orchesella cincta]
MYLHAMYLQHRRAKFNLIAVRSGKCNQLGFYFNMNLTPEEVNKMKVVELRAELQVRSLDPKGVKAVLVDRLLAALGHEGGAAATVGNGSSQASLDLSSGDADESKLEDEADGSQEEAADVAEADASTLDEDQNMEQSLPSQPNEPEVVEATIDEDDDNENVEEDQEKEKEKVPSVVVAVPEVKEESTPAPVETKDEKDAPATATPETATSADDTEGGSEEVEKMETDQDQDTDNAKRKIEAVNGDTTEENKTKKPRTEETIVFKNVPLNEPEFEESAVLLDWCKYSYQPTTIDKSDLNLKISTENFLEAEPTVYEDFPFAYAGVKATYGFTKGKVGFEAKWVKSCEVRSDFGDKETKHVFRVGWSDVNADLQLGEDKLSIGYDVSGKVYNSGEIQDLGGVLVEGDVVSAYLDLESDPVEVKFAKNGEIVGEPVKIPKAELEGKSLYPHVLVRNVKFEVNFGSKDPAHEVLEGFQMVGKTEDTDRIRGPTRPEKKDDCELIMLVGLACSGKTKWAKDFIKNNPDKHYNILGTSTAVERALKDQSILSSQKAPRVFDSFFMKAGKFVERLVDIAPSRKRNYILDQLKYTV